MDAVRDRCSTWSTGAASSLPLTQTVKVVTPEPLGVEEVEYKSVLVAFEDDPFSEEAVATAARLAARRRRGDPRVSLIVTVPTHLPLDAPLEAARRSEAQSKIEQAKLIGGLRVTGHVERVRPGQAGHGDRRGGARDQGGGDRACSSRYRNGTPLYGKTLADRARGAALPGDRRRRAGGRRGPTAER